MITSLWGQRGAAGRLTAAFLAVQPAERNVLALHARLSDRLEPESPQSSGWPWRMAAWALIAHLTVLAVAVLAGKVHLPKPPPEPMTISLVSETTPQGANASQPVPAPQPQPKPAPTAQSLPMPPPPLPSPVPAAPLSQVADLPPPPPPAPPTPQTPVAPQPPQQAAMGARIKAQKTAAVTVAVLHPAVAFADNQAPDYPQSAIDAGEQGMVRFTLYLTADGHVSRFVLTQSSGYADLDESVRSAALGWRYEPAMRGDVAVPSTVQFHVRFEPR